MGGKKDPFDILFNPCSVAVIGASGNPAKMGHQCLLSLRDGGFSGSIYPVHPVDREILGMAAYPNLNQVPGQVDLVILVVPAAEVLPALAECREKGVRGVIIITAGFREIDLPEGPKLQGQLADLANRAGIKIIGPNTFGLVNTHARLNASFTPFFSQIRPGPISAISQSGGVFHLIAYQALDEKIGFGKIVGLGNRCNVEFIDLLPFLAEDEETRCIVLFIEGVDDPRSLVEAIRKIVMRKPVVALKSGRYAPSLLAARSHTGSLAGRYEIYESALRQAGAVVVEEPGELLDVAKILTRLPPISGRNVAVFSFQAGPGILLTDAVAGGGLHMASFSPGTQEKLNRLLPPFTIRTNPVDLAFARNGEVFEELVEAVLGDPNVDSLVVFLLHHPFRPFREISVALQRQKEASPKPILLCIKSPGHLMDEDISEIEARGIPVYPLPGRAIRALRGLVAYGRVLEKIGVKL